jgi:mannose-1-phosphate guanylyltransferase
VTAIHTASASIEISDHTPASYLEGPPELASAHASPTNLQLCFAKRDHRRTVTWSSGLGRPWAIVLAGGSGTRLAQLTGAADGSVVPKQYCSLHGERSLLADALARADALVGRDRVVVVVAAQHEGFWRRELHDRDRRNVVVQPCNRGTAAGVLLPLLSVRARDPHAHVTLLPADHFVADEGGLLRALRCAHAAAASSGRVVLLGIAPEGPETDYGWIEPGASGNQVHTVRRFVEKPDRATAERLMQAGAVWNSFLLSGSVPTLVGLYERRLPALLRTFCRAGFDTDASRAGYVYESLADTDFCRALLTGSEDALGLHVAPNCGWTDLGTPARVARCGEWLAHSTCTRPRPGSLADIAVARFGWRTEAQASR